MVVVVVPQHQVGARAPALAAAPRAALQYHHRLPCTETVVRTHRARLRYQAADAAANTQASSPAFTKLYAIDSPDTPAPTTQTSALMFSSSFGYFTRCADASLYN